MSSDVCIGGPYLGAVIGMWHTFCVLVIVVLSLGLHHITKSHVNFTLIKIYFAQKQVVSADPKNN